MAQIQAKRFQIFVSSTYTDLVQERQAAIKAIVDLGHMPAGMEGFPAIDMEQFEYIKKVIDQCDYYVLIIGDRYGSTAPDGVSFTEKEYHYAIKTGRVVLAFVKDSPSEPLDAKREDKKFKAFKEHVKTKRVVHFWNAGDDLKYPVSRSLREAFEQHPREGWVRANKPKPVLEWLLNIAAMGAVFFAFIYFMSGSPPPINKTGVTSPGGQSLPAIIAPPKDAKENLSQTDISTKVAIWQSVQTKYTNEFTRILNDVSDLQSSWEATDKTAKSGWLARIPMLRKRFADNSQQLEAFRQEYAQYQDISDALKQTRSDDFLAALDQFARGYGQDAEHQPENYNKTMRPLAGELKRQWDRMAAWNITLQRQAAVKQTELR